MVQAKGLTDKEVADIILNNDSEEDFGSDNNSELSESEYESQSDSDTEDKLPMHSVDETAAVTILMMMHNNNGMVDKTTMKTGEPVKKPKPLTDCNKGNGGEGWWQW